MILLEDCHRLESWLWNRCVRRPRPLPGRQLAEPDLCEMPFRVSSSPEHIRNQGQILSTLAHESPTDHFCVQQLTHPRSVHKGAVHHTWSEVDYIGHKLD